MPENIKEELDSTDWDKTKNTADKGNKAKIVSKKFFLNQIEREWLATEEAAHFLSVSPNALRVMVHRDQIRAYKVGRRLRFKLADCRSLFKRKGS